MDRLKDCINRYRVCEDNIATAENNKGELYDMTVAGLCESIISFLEKELDIPPEVIEKTGYAIREVADNIFRWYRLYVRNGGIE